MQNVAEILRLRVLLCFLNLDEKDCTVTNIARILGEEKYTITRALDNSERTMEVIEATKERYRVKYELRDKKAFSGSVL